MTSYTINPLADVIRFGFTPGHNVTPAAGTDFRHEFHYIGGVPSHMLRFGFQPVSPVGGSQLLVHTPSFCQL